MKRFVALLLAALIVCACATAFADSGYVSLKKKLQTSGSTDGAKGLGTPLVDDGSGFKEYKQVIVVISMEDDYVALIGPNASGKWEYCFWNNVAVMQQWNWLEALCRDYKAINTSVKSTGSFTIMIYLEDSEDAIFVNNQTKANQVLDIFK